MTTLTYNKDPQSPRDEYWWKEEDPFILVSKLQPFNDFGNAAYANNPIYQTWFRNQLLYFSNIIQPSQYDTSLVFKGKQGELIQVLVPISRSLIRQMIGIITKQKLNFRCVADASMGNIMDTMRLGNAVTRDIVKRQHLDLKYAQAVENELITGMGHLYVRWRTDKGEYFARDPNGVSHFKGDVRISVPNVWDVSFDQTIPDPKDWYWVQVREIHNRWDLIAQRPDLRDEILALPSVRNSQGWFNIQASRSPSDEDLCYIWNAYHIPTPSLPEGRYVAYGSPTCVLFNGPNFYKRLPVYTSVSESVPQSSLGYPFYSNLLPLQEIFDSVISANATNTNMFAVQSVIAPRGSGINPSNIMGMNFLQYTPQPNLPGGGKPEPLQLTASAPESFKFMDQLKSLMQDLSLVNSALRGEPPPQVSSGTAIATLTATALEQINSTAKSSRDMLKTAMLGAIECYQRFASVPRTIAMAGAGLQSSSLTFQGKDLDPIRDIDLQEVNPLMQTLSGRVEIADKVLQQGLVTNLKGYFAVLEGAQPDELYKNELSQDDLVNRENEAIAQGQPVKVLNIDDHAYHIMMHSIPLNDPKVRLSAVAEAYLAHILEHYEEANKQDPKFAAMVQTGKMPEGGMQPPMPMDQSIMPGMPMPGGPEAEPDQNPIQGAAPVAEPAKPAMDQLARAAGG